MPLANNAAPERGTLEPYINSCVALAQEKLHHFSSLAEIAAREKDLNRYPIWRSFRNPGRSLSLMNMTATPSACLGPRMR